MSSLNPDREMLAQFAGLMFKRARPDGFVSLRAFPEKTKEKKEKPIFIESDPGWRRDFLEITIDTRHVRRPHGMNPPSSARRSRRF